MANLITEHTEMYSTLIIREPECSGKCCRSDEHILREDKTPFHFDSEKKKKRGGERGQGPIISFRRQIPSPLAEVFSSEKAARYNEIPARENLISSPAKRAAPINLYGGRLTAAVAICYHPIQSGLTHRHTHFIECQFDWPLLLHLKQFQF